MNLDWLRGPLLTHRGFHGPRSPENSLPAVEGAVLRGLGVEVDVRLSADNVPVIHHDATLRRMCGSAHLVRSLPAAALTRIRLGDGDHSIPRLSDVLTIVAGRVPLVLDLKTGPWAVDRAHLVTAVARAVAGYRGPLAVVALDPLILNLVRSHMPTAVRGQNGGLPRLLATRAAWATHRRPIVDRWPNRLSAPHFLSLNVAWLPHLDVRQLRRDGVFTIGWTVRTRQQLQSLTGRLDNLMVEGEGVPPAHGGVCDPASAHDPIQRHRLASVHDGASLKHL